MAADNGDVGLALARLNRDALSIVNLTEDVLERDVYTADDMHAMTCAVESFEFSVKLLAEAMTRLADVEAG